MEFQDDEELHLLSIRDSRTERAKSDKFFKGVVLTLISLIFIFQLLSVGIIISAGKYLQPKIEQIWNDYTNVSGEYYKLYPVIEEYVEILITAAPEIQNISSYINKGESIINDLDQMVGTILPSINQILDDFKQLTQVFVPNQMSFAHNQTIFTEAIENCARKYGFCKF